MSEHYEQGRRDCRGFYTSPTYAGFPRDIAVNDAMKFFLPPIRNDMMQVQRPYPRPVQEWIKGWQDEKREAGYGA